MENNTTRGSDPTAHPIRQENLGILNLQSTVRDVRLLFPEARKQTPIVLVPGFVGWGTPLLGAINYFGGVSDIAKELADEGYIVIQVRISPISSNRERACEIFQQLTNIRVDAAGSSTGFDEPGDPPTASNLINVNYGNLLVDRPLSPLPAPQTWKAVVHRAEYLPENWRWSEQNKVIFVCHSQGGNSVRQLLYYMSGSAPQDLNQFSRRDERSRVKAVVTLGTPHKGTTIVQFAKELLSQDTDLNAVVDLVALTSFARRQDRVLDLGLDHWGFTRIDTQETYQAMRKRIAPYVIRWFNGTANGAGHVLDDNSIAGAQALNNATATGSNIPTYFFTMSFCATTPLPDQNLTAQDIREFFQLFPFGGIPNLLGIPRLIASFLSLTNRLRISPSLLSVLGWITGVANRHLGTLGYFALIPRPGSQIPRPDMLAVVAPFAYALGGIHVPGEDRELNDGIVNTMSMDGPEGRVKDGKRFADELGARGVGVGPETFWHFGSNTTIDHADQLGIFTDPKTNEEVKVMYRLFAELADRLP